MRAKSSPFWVTSFLGATLLMVGIAAGLPRPDAEAGTLLLVFPPWWSRPAVWQAALPIGDVVVDVLPFVIVLHSEVDGLSARAWKAGAVIVLDPGQFGLCGAKIEGKLG